MTGTKDIIRLLVEYARIQKELVDRIFANHDHPSGRENFVSSIPKSGFVTTNEYWEYHVHGSGITFKQPRSGVVVDAHAAMVEVPNGIDSWRIGTYLESCGIDTVSYKGHHYPVDDASLRELFTRMQGDKMLSPSGVVENVLQPPVPPLKSA